jgi:hypothetical protein
MPKNFLQDMVRVKRLRNKKAISEKPVPNIKVDENFFNERFTGTLDSNSSKASNHKLWIIAGLSAIFLFFGLSYNFSKVSVVVHPKIKTITLNQSLVASSDNTDNLSFKLVSLSGEEEKVVAATNSEDVSKVAEGSVVLYNAYNSSPQIFSADTRLSGSNGKIYKTKTKVTVPGKSKSGKPGSVKVAIYASSPGPEYNSSPLDFQIVGLKGTPKYQKFYGRSLGSITGGFKGKIGVIDPKNKEGIVSILNETLKSKLLQKATAQIPPGFILFKDASFLNTELIDPTQEQIKEDSLIIKTKGVFYGFLFREEELTKKIIEGNLPNYDKNPVFIPDLKNLNFVLAQNDSKNLGSINPQNISFTLKGNAQITWLVDTDKLKKDLL